MRICWLIPLLAACSDYDLRRPSDVETTHTIDTGQRPEAEGEPDIAITPQVIDFGSFPPDCITEPVTVTITNNGTAPLVVSDILASGDGASAFVLNASPPTLSPSDSYPFQVTFSPQGPLSYDVVVAADSNDPDEPRASIVALGEGATFSTYEESLRQEAYESVDVLWIVDNSGSMSDALDLVRDNFAAYITEFIDLDVDYHLGIITTDMNDPDQSGRLMNGTFATPADADPAGIFLAALETALTTSGAGSEKGFAATRAALSEPLLSTTNAGFLRKDAALAVIVVTDEDDGSGESASSFIKWFEAIKTDPERSRFHAICGDEGLGCSAFINNDMITAQAGQRYIDAAYASGGFWSSVCTSDYTSALSEMGMATVGLLIRFPLAETPANVGEMVVMVDGNAVPQDSSNGWTYNSTDNVVTFHGDAIPEDGSSIEVSYPVAEPCP